MEARRWIEGVDFPKDRPLINVSQAAPVDPPPDALCEAIACFAIEVPSVHVYGPVLGLPELRSEVALECSGIYGGEISFDDIAITSGCNQAFVASIATLARKGDEVILPTPWYFNHKMWLDMSGIRAVPLPCGEGMIPDAEAARELITDRTRAIVLVTPNNPTGAEYPSSTVTAFFEVCREAGVALIIDETYRDFHSVTGAPHDILADPDWRDTLIHLYSFSKAYRLTGHRVGAMVASPERLSQVEKFLDTVAICPNQLGQQAALWGMRNLRQWLAGERDEILARRSAIVSELGALPGWDVLCAGAYFAFVRHPFQMSSHDLAKNMVHKAGVLALPGTMFTPGDDPLGPTCLRVAFANIDVGGIQTLADRLRALEP